MSEIRTKSALSPKRRSLVELMSSIGFGRIENLTVVSGEPDLSPLPKITREIKLGCASCPRPEMALEDFVLRAQVVDLFWHLDQVGTGQLDVLEIKDGLPFRVFVRR